MTDDSGDDYVLYDGECPFCRAYIALATLRQFSPQLEVRDARQHPDLVQELRARGFEINDGMVVRFNGQYHHAQDATRVLAELADEAGPARRGLLAAIGRAPWSAWLYPWLNRIRKAWLRHAGTAMIR